MKVQLSQKLAHKLSRFKRDEDGSIVVLTLFLIIAMIWTAGIAVDMMRFETYRARLQSTIDRAVLAAADLDSCLGTGADPAEVVRDYVEKNGFGNQLGDISVMTTDSSCEVTAQATVDVNTIFMKLIGFGETNSGVQTLGTTASSGATESIHDVEISLVLDVSGSMRGTKIEQLRTSATDFVRTVHETVEQDRLSFSIVPYSTTVSIGADLYSQYRTRFSHNDSYCLDLPESTYLTTQIPHNTRYDQSAHFDADGGASFSTVRAATQWVCNPDPASYVLPFTNNLAVMEEHIAALEADAWTSIEMGANWGVALLDPDTRPIAQGLANQGMIDQVYASHPADYDIGNTLKVLVLMTDGENTRDYVLSTSHRHQWSDVWFAWNMEYDDDGNFLGDNFAYSQNLVATAADASLRGVNETYQDANSSQQFFVQDPEVNNFDGDGIFGEDYYLVEGEFVDHDNRPWTDLRRDDSPPVWWDDRYGARQQYNDIWRRFTIRAHAWNFRGDQYNDFGLFNAWYDDIVTVTYSDDKDERLDHVCSAAKAEGIVVFSIGFEVSNRAAEVMEDCATSPNHFYRVDGLEIASAFNSIANQISALRLFQ